MLTKSTGHCYGGDSINREFRKLAIAHLKGVRLATYALPVEDWVDTMLMPYFERVYKQQYTPSVRPADEYGFQLPVLKDGKPHADGFKRFYEKRYVMSQ